MFDRVLCPADSGVTLYGLVVHHTAVGKRRRQITKKIRLTTHEGEGKKAAMSPATEPRRGKEKRERKYGGGLSSRKHHHLQLCYSRGSNVADNDYGYKYVKSLASSLGPSIFYWSAHYFRHLSCVICIFIATSVLKRFILYYRRTFSTTYLSESFENSCRNLNGFSRLISKRLKDFCIRRRHWFLKMSPWRDGFVADIFPIF